MHTVKTNLSDVEFKTTAPEFDGEKHYHKAITTSDALARSNADLAINASFFYPFREKHLLDYYPHHDGTVYPVGTTIHEGVLYGSCDGGWPSFVINQNGSVALKNISQEDISRDQSIQFAVSGEQYLVKEGAVAIKEETKPYPSAILAMDKTKTHLWLVVVDGKQYHYSLGLGLRALSELLVEKGIYNAIELDGGGSATLAYKDKTGEVQVLNRPIHTHIPNRERPVANHLMVYLTKNK